MSALETAPDGAADISAGAPLYALDKSDYYSEEYDNDLLMEMEEGDMAYSIDMEGRQAQPPARDRSDPYNVDNIPNKVEDSDARVRFGHNVYEHVDLHIDSSRDISSPQFANMRFSPVTDENNPNNTAVQSTSSQQGTDITPHNKSSKTSDLSVIFSDMDARLFRRNLNIYMVKNALLKQQVLDVTKQAEEKFVDLQAQLRALTAEHEK